MIPAKAGIIPFARCEVGATQGIMTTVIYLLLSALLTTIIWMLQDTRKSVKERQDRQEKATEAVAKDLADLKSALPRQYVLREDFIRTAATLEAKIDRMATDTAEIKEAIAKLGGGK